MASSAKAAWALVGQNIGEDFAEVFVVFQDQDGFHQSTGLL